MFKTIKKLFGAKPKKKAVARPGKRVKKAAPKKKFAKKPAPKAAAQKPIGKVTHYYGGIKVAIVKFKQDIRKGIKVRFRGATTDFVQTLDSIQYDHKSIAKAPKGKEIGIKVKKRVRDGDEVYAEKK